MTTSARRFAWVWLAPAGMVAAAVALRAGTLAALGIGLAAGLSLSGSI